MTVDSNNAPVNSRYGKDAANALKTLDESRIGWFHVKSLLVSGSGFFTDAYGKLIKLSAILYIVNYNFYACLKSSLN